MPKSKLLLKWRELLNTADDTTLERGFLFKEKLLIVIWILLSFWPQLKQQPVENVMKLR